MRGQYYGTISDKVIVSCTSDKPGRRLKAIIEYKDEVSRNGALCMRYSAQHGFASWIVVVARETEVRAGGCYLLVRPGG